MKAMIFKLPRSVFLLAIAFIFPSLLAAQDLPNKTTKSGFYFETLVGSGSLAHREGALSKRDIGGFAYGLKLGNKFYFGDDSKDFRIGMDLNWFSVHGSLMRYQELDRDYRVVMTNLSIINPGIGMAWAFGNDLGLDANFNIGPNFMIASDDGEGSGLGLRLGPQVKFHYHVLSIGLEYRYANILSNYDLEDLRTNIYGFTIGLKF